MSLFGCEGQSQDVSGFAVDPRFSEEINRYLNFTVPAISCDQLKASQEKFLVLDAREPEEFMVSHIAQSKNVGFKKFDISMLDDVTKETPIVVYCSIGYRSEKIGEKLKNAGFSHVYNLYGSIFEWINQSNAIVDINGLPTKKIHTYNRKWSRWVKDVEVEKVW